MFELALYDDVTLVNLLEEETDPDTRQLLLNEAHFRALAFCQSQEAN